MRIIRGLMHSWRCWGLMLSILLALGDALAVGSVPVPALVNVNITGGVVRDPVQGHFVYRYTVGSDAQNRGRIFQMVIDVTAARGYWLPGESDAFRIPVAGGNRPYAEMRYFFEAFAEYKRSKGVYNDEFVGTRHVPFGQAVPSGWVGGLTIDGGAMFLLTEGECTRGIDPGTTLGGFELQSHGHPTLRDIRISPYWMHAVENHDNVLDEERMQAAQIEANLDVAMTVLGPGSARPGSAEHWDVVRRDLERMPGLGWIGDPVWGAAVMTTLAQARTALEAKDSDLTRQRLTEMRALIDNSTPAQRRNEVADHLRENLQFLIDWTIPENPPEPRVTLVPERASAKLGEQHEFVLRLVDLANGLRPLAEREVGFQVETGPHAGISDYRQTDAEGYARFTYRGFRQGIDRVVGSISHGEITYAAEAKALWLGGADLVVPLFIPPLLETEGGWTFRVIESTANIGNAAAPESMTRYYLAATPITDISQARIVGERRVPALGPREEHQIGPVIYRIPDDLPANRYYLAACADADGTIVEKDENNNCSFNDLPLYTPILLPAKSPSRPPECTAAVASPATLWPPNHKWATVGIVGVSHPDNRPFDLRIAAITQDEPVNGLGDGDTAPDGAGVGTANAQVRAERSGTGNGRVYRIAFTATDNLGQNCTGIVTVGVPHDQRLGTVAVDDGQPYDSMREQ